MKRPHFKKGSAELRRLFESHRDDMAVVQELLEELKHRKSRNAQSLMTDILARIAEVEPEPQNDDEGAFESAIEFREDQVISEFEHEHDESRVSAERYMANEATRSVQKHHRTGDL